MEPFYSNFYSSARATAHQTEVNPFRCQGFVRNGTIACRDGHRRAIQSLPAFLRALLVTDGTVTKILEAYFWEPVVVDTLHQAFTVMPAEIPWIEINPGDNALVRRVRLRGGDSNREYAQADSVIRAERVPEHFRQRLIDREIGIGALIRDSGLESYREVMEVGVNPGQAPTPGDSLFRTYRIIIDKEPVILITETFPLALFCDP
ncbi:chorismate--pyruvate lyase family protein [Rhabdochromatium marinum]|uniref:chorismate--pyruvate lyase family protein n=1 Tax=Rhabdochromatium marinum TaxID=48729 RepID=UPI001902E45C|nr:chorismate pyruvate-lyase family protein [Rhabdochromatium marinum]MBK1647156.1 4-hydroxybenzoate synthetase [Rhabdochromatium marinum]